MARVGRTAARRTARRAGTVARTVVLVLLGVVVLAAGTLLAVPAWRAAVLPSATVTRTAPPPADWRPPATAAPPVLPLDELQPVAAPPAKALAARVQKPATAASGPPGLVVVDPATGRTLVRRSDRPLVPASTMKLLTGLVALDSLGGSRTLRTAVLSPRRGVLVLRGGGDPLLTDARSTGRASLQRLAADTATALLAQGVRRVRLGYDATLFSGSGWHPRWTDAYRYSVAPIRALMVNGGRSATGEAQADPARSAARAFAARLTRAGVRVTSVEPGRAGSSADEVAAVASPSIAQLVEHTLRFSDNVAAETLARHVALADGKGGGFADAQAAVRSRLKALGLLPAGTVIDDNSGLSRNNRIAPSALAGALKRIVDEPRHRSLLLGLPVGGVSGTLYDRFDDKPERAGRGVVRAKTGSLRDVTALAGYLVTEDGAPLVFAVLANDVRRPDASRDWIDRTTAAWAACGCG